MIQNHALSDERRLASRLPLFLINCTYAPSWTIRLSSFRRRYSALLMFVKPHFFEMMIFWRPGNL